ncbi:MAG: AAA family ATPase [SAR324 cluster bacterium]|nr:AAA family ATPase [SAR324 cluster bacterium]
MSISLSHFTLKAEEALLKAQQMAAEGHQAKVEPEHLLLSLLEQNDPMTEFCLDKLQVENGLLQQKIQLQIRNFPKDQTNPAQTFISRSLHGIILSAEKEATLLNETYTNVDHLLLGLLNFHEGFLGEIWNSLDASAEHLRKELSGLSKAEQIIVQGSKLSESAIEDYCLDLVAMARLGELDPVIGMEVEVRNLIQVLSRRTKNNPVLLGEAGVGKTAIVECLAQRIVRGDVPEWLKDRRLVSLDLATMIAGTTYRGEFEKRMKQLIREVEESRGHILLFVDELHMLVGAGGAEGSVDAANMLKPALARGRLRCIGATTLKEYKKYIEKDAPLARRFQPILIREPSIDETITILRGLRQSYQSHHGVVIQDDALVSAAQLSERYLRERFLPDKAIDLVDEAAASLRLQMDSMPIALDNLERRLSQILNQINTLRREKDEKSIQQRNSLVLQAEQLQNQQQMLQRKWQDERLLVERIRQLRQAITETRQAEWEAQRTGDLDLAAKLHYETLDQLEAQLQEAESNLNRRAERLVKEEVDAEDIAQVVSRRTGIPIHRMLADEKEKLVRLEEFLEQRIMGQSEALSRVASAIRRSRAGVQDPQRPIGSFIFMGSSGVGKTELGLALANFLFDDDKSLIRFDMSEYMEKQSVNRLLGADPGFVGFEEGGLLTEKVRQSPYSVLLFDEIEKAHIDIFNLFLQILDDGQLTDSQGRRADFRNTLIIMTTNIGHDLMKEDRKKKDVNDLQKEARQLLLNHFRPEFLNRIDEIIPFRNLSLSHIRHICRMQLEQLQTRLTSQGIQLVMTEAAEVYLAQRGYDPVFGARPMKRTLQRDVQDPIAIRLLDGELRSGMTIQLDASQNKLHFKIS